MTIKKSKRPTMSSFNKHMVRFVSSGLYTAAEAIKERGHMYRLLYMRRPVRRT